VSHEVRLLQPSDDDWFFALWDDHKKILGLDPASWRTLQAYKQDPTRHFIYCVPGKGFACFYKRRDGWHTLSAIAVSSTARKQGVGRALIAAVAGPIRCKTNTDNEASNLFYQWLGFCCTDTVRTKSGQLVNVYERAWW
jgi:ribosomal protein S18 acetylase RimI-like enzyme